MSDLSIEYSLNTPIFVNSNILEQKIFYLTKNNSMSGGGFGFNILDSISFLIGLIIIIVGFVLLWFKNDLIETEAIIKTQSCDDNSMCKINIIYTVDSIQYSKIISMNKNNAPDSSTIKIYYQSSEPNSIQLYNPNYSIIGIGMIIIGIFIMIYCVDNNYVSSDLTNSEINLYSNTVNKNGLKIVYSE